jgi:hypothetical protein
MVIYFIEEINSERDKLVHEGHHNVINNSLPTYCQSRTYNNWFQTKHNTYSQNTHCGLPTMQYKEDNMNLHVRPGTVQLREEYDGEDENYIWR